jgi:succinate dehydrogenase/fumarate reductase-like Fe-S protein
MCALAHDAGSYIHPITMLAAKRVELGSTTNPRSPINAIDRATRGVGGCKRLATCSSARQPAKKGEEGTESSGFKK